MLYKTGDGKCECDTHLSRVMLSPSGGAGVAAGAAVAGTGRSATDSCTTASLVTSGFKTSRSMTSVLMTPWLWRGKMCLMFPHNSITAVIFILT